jgi:hypothetical protein
VSLFEDDMISYVENYNKSMKLLEIINEFSKVPCYKVDSLKINFIFHRLAASVNNETLHK